MLELYKCKGSSKLRFYKNALNDLVSKWFLMKIKIHVMAFI